MVRTSNSSYEKSLFLVLLTDADFLYLTIKFQQYRFHKMSPSKIINTNTTYTGKNILKNCSL